MKGFVIAASLALFALPSLAQSNTPQASCTAYFGVLQYDPSVPGLLVARMSDSQAKWFMKNGNRQYPGLCLSLEKAQYLIVWTISKQVTTTEQTVQRTAQVDTSTRGSESGSFKTYGALLTWGNYSGTFSSNSTSTVTYEEGVPVVIAADHCSLYVLKSVGPSVWGDIRNKTPEPLAVFTTETHGPNKMTGGDRSTAATVNVMGAVVRLARKDPTTQALDSALKFIFEHGAQTTPAAALLSREEKSGNQVAPTTQPKDTQLGSPANTAKVMVSSEPTLGDIYVDGNFMGNTPSVIELPEGSHTVRVEAKGRTSWSRTLSLTAGSKVTLQALLDAEK